MSLVRCRVLWFFMTAAAAVSGQDGDGNVTQAAPGSTSIRHNITTSSSTQPSTGGTSSLMQPYSKSTTLSVEPYPDSITMINSTVAVTREARQAQQETSPENTLQASLVYPPDADLLLGALFPLHTSKRDPVTGAFVCTDFQEAIGLAPLEAMLYTLNEVNDDPNLLPGVKLGALVLDSCNSPTLALDQTLGFIKGFLAAQNMHHTPEFECSDGNAPQFRGGQFDKVVGVVGAQQSSVSTQIASVLRVIQMPQISYLSTAASLSDRDRYPYFLRTVPSDTAQARAILSIMREFEWTYGSVVYSRGEYGERGYEELRRQAELFDVCLTRPAHRLALDDPEDDYQAVVQHLLDGDANVVVVFAEAGVARQLLETVRKSGKQQRFVWLGSDGWSVLDTTGVETVAEGAIAVHPLARKLPGFAAHYTALTLENNNHNPWFVEYWNNRRTVSTYQQHWWLHFVRDAVYAFAHALHNMWLEACKGEAGLCTDMAHEGHIHGDVLLAHLHNVSFLDVSGRTFSFESSGSGPARYTVFNYRRRSDDVFHLAWAPSGNFSDTTQAGPELQLELGQMHFRQGVPFPNSSCGQPCEPGHAKILLRDGCCWLCRACEAHEYLAPEEQMCHPCPSTCMAPRNPSQPGGPGCDFKPEKFIDYLNTWAVTSLAFASLGIFSTVLVGVIFWLYLETPVIKAASRELSYLLLAGILLSFIMSFVIVAPPSPATCGLTRFFLGFSYTLCYAAILTKTNRISRIFTKAPGKSRKARFTSPMSQVVIVGLLVSVEVVINVVWLVHTPSHTDHLCPRDDPYRIRICGGFNDYSYLVGLAYPLLLVLLCTLYAIKTRKCPGGFNEARYIAFTNYTTCILWLIFVPLYLASAASDHIRIVTLALSLSLGAFVQLGCLFCPKVYVVLFKPEKNTREAVMTPSRDSCRTSMAIPAPQSAPAVFFLNAGNQNDRATGGVGLSYHHESGVGGGRVNQVCLPPTQSVHHTTHREPL